MGGFRRTHTLTTAMVVPCRFDVDSDGDLSLVETRYMFKALVAHMDNATCGLEEVGKDKSIDKLFHVMDKDHRYACAPVLRTSSVMALTLRCVCRIREHSNTVSFFEVCMAIRCAGVDPYLTLLFSSEQLAIVRGLRVGLHACSALMRYLPCSRRNASHTVFNKGNWNRASPTRRRWRLLRS